MHLHTRSNATWLPRASSFLILLTLVLVSTQGIESIVKQQQQQQQQQQPQQQQQQQQQAQPQQQSQQQRSDEPGNNAQLQFSNQPQMSVGQAPAGGAQAAQANANSQSGYAPSSAQQSGPGQQSGARPQMSLSQDSMSGYAPQAAKAQQAASPYLDSMAAAASNPEQSYQAAAQSVNMALANSGIFGPSSSYQANQQAQSQPQQQQQAQQQSQSGVGQQQSAAGSQSALNPLHYFYYPAKDSANVVGPGAQAAAGSGAKAQLGSELLANQASGQQYQSMSAAAYPAYADQYSGGANGGFPSPDAAASSQDPSYLPQPMAEQQQQPPQQQQQQQQHGQYGQSQPGNGQLQQQAQYNPSSADLSGYASSPSASSISFNGPSASGAGASQSQQQSQAQSPNMMQASGEYLNSHMGAGSQQQQFSSQTGPYQNNLFNQLASGGDLSTSNFGNNAGGLSSIASYMSPNAQGPQQDLFSGAGQAFSSAASQLAPAAIAPPQSQQQQQQQAQSPSSLFSGASALFGANSQQAGQQPQQQQQPAGAYNYLNSFLTPQQYTQLTGQPMSMASEQSPLSMGAALGSLHQQQQQQQAAMGAGTSPSSAASSMIASSTGASAGSSSKRFGLGSFIMPMLALAGLSLLIPTMSNIGTAVGRKKRSIVEERASSANRQQQILHPTLNGASQILKENSISEYMDKLERYYSIYRNAIESDDCLNRLICEFGDAVKDVTGGKSAAAMSVIEPLLPVWAHAKLHLFRESALNSAASSKDKCRDYVCHNVGGGSSSGSRQH